MHKLLNDRAENHSAISEDVQFAQYSLPYCWF